MKTQSKISLGMVTACLAWVSWAAAGADLDPALQAKIDAKIKEVQAWATDPVLVNAIKKHNTGLTPDESAMTQDKWQSLSILDPFVRAYTKNEAAAFLKAKQSDVVTEAFVSGADGTKVAFIAKTTNWSHKGKEKHEAPMAGKTWTGSIETDESTGQRQVQISVPVMDGGKPIGSLVIGLGVSKLSA